MSAPFHLVWNPKGFAPKFHHDSYASAEKEARRLAASNPSQQFYVLAPMSVVQVRDPVEVTTFGASGDESDTVEFPF